MPAAGLPRALASLRGLSVGDALGARFSTPANLPLLGRREVPGGPWQWTDDTQMACSVLAVLAGRWHVDQEALAASFARHHDTDRGYGPAVSRLLRQVREGGDWRTLAGGLFHGQGSWGNGASMRIAPLGAWYAGDPEQATRQAEISAYITTSTPKRWRVASVAAAAALTAADVGPPEPGAMLDAVAALLPPGSVAAGVRRARDTLDHDDPAAVAAVLGCGRRASAQDTVPFALWSAACGLGDFEAAFWATAQAGGDDTNCAIVGGIVAAGGGTPPPTWQARTEPLPEWVPATA